jgi:hypothetical protein
MRSASSRPSRDDAWAELEEIDAEGRAFIAAGWASYLPGTAFDLYSAILRVRACGEPASEDSIRRFLVDCDPAEACPVGEFDAPVEPYHGDDAETASWDRRQWSAFRAEAGRHGLAVATPNEILGFLCALGLIQREGADAWSAVAPVPLLEDVIEVSRERRQELASMRAQVQFATEKRLVREWLDRQGASAREPVVTSIAALADSLRLSPAAVRSALGLLVQDGAVDSTPSGRARAGLSER